MPKTLRCYYPYPKFPSVSITGGRCLLNCKHCGGHYLSHMPDVSTPEKLREYALQHSQAGGIGILISGGSMPDGSLPLDRFFGAIRWIKDNTDLVINLHPGLVDRSGGEKIAASGVDFVSADVVGSDDTIRGVYGLDASVEKYADALRYLADTGVLVVPHVCVGLDYGRVKGEMKALEIASAVKPEVIGVIALIPSRNTVMENIVPPKVADIAAVVSAAKKLSPGSEVSLGCMHSRRDKLRLEWAAIEAGASRITLPSRETVSRAIAAGYAAINLNSCCGLPRRLESAAFDHLG